MTTDYVKPRIKRMRKGYEGYVYQPPQVKANPCVDGHDVCRDVMSGMLFCHRCGKPEYAWEKSPHGQA